MLIGDSGLLLIANKTKLMLMELFMPNVFLYGGCLVATSFLLGAVGMFVMRLMPEWRGGSNGFLTLFNAIMIGLTMLVPLFAVVWARGNSIMWIAVLLWVYYIMRTRPHVNETDEWKLDWKAVLLAVVVLVGVYVLFYYLFFVRSGGYLCGDYFFYANISSLIIEEHIETNRFLSLFKYPVPYHYGESWLTAICAFLFGIKPVFVELLVSYPLFCFMIVLGIASLCNSLACMNNLFALIFGMIFMFYKPIIALFIPWHYTLFPMPKLYIVTLFVLWGALMFLKCDFRKAFVAMCFLVPFYSTVSAGVLTFVFLMAIGLKWYETRSWCCLWNEYSFASVAVALLFFMFYMVQVKSPIETPENVFDRVQAIQALLYAARWIVKSSILLLPSFLVMLYLGKKNPERFGKGWIAVAAVAASCAISILLGGILKEVNRDGFQVMTNYIDPVRVVCCFVVFISFLKVIHDCFSLKPITCYLIYGSFLLFPIVYSDEGFQGRSWNWPKNGSFPDIETNVIKEVKGKDAWFGVFRFFSADEKRYYDIDDFNFLPYFLSSGRFVFYEMSELELPDDYPILENDSHHHAFVEYATLQKRDGTFVSNEQSMLDFVKFMGIEYLIVEPRASLPGIFEDKVELVVKRNGSVMYKVVS